MAFMGDVDDSVEHLVTTTITATRTTTPTTTPTTSDAKTTAHRSADSSLLLSPRTFLESVKVRKTSNQSSSPRDQKLSLTTTSLPTVTSTNKGKWDSLPKIGLGYGPWK